MAFKFEFVPLGLLLLLLMGRFATAQYCGCTNNMCCSQYGYCGTGDAYCGDGCQEGPCDVGEDTGVVVSDVITDAFFKAIIHQAASTGCPGKTFYTRSAFLSAAATYPKFGTTGTTTASKDDSKRELAAFFAHVTHETGFMCHIEEVGGEARDYCDHRVEVQQQWPCYAGKHYHGRGPLQLSWNYNYGPAGRNISFDGLRFPETVGQDVVVSFKTAVWFWMTHCHLKIIKGKGFGETTRAINGMECNGGNPDAVQARANYYTEYCKQLNVSTGAASLTC